MSEVALLRAVGVRNADRSWYGAIESSGADGYVWICLHEHGSLGQARACAEERLAAHRDRGGAWSGPTAPAYRTKGRRRLLGG